MSTIIYYLPHSFAKSVIRQLTINFNSIFLHSIIHGFSSSLFFFGIFTKKVPNGGYATKLSSGSCPLCFLFVLCHHLEGFLARQDELEAFLHQMSQFNPLMSTPFLVSGRLRAVRVQDGEGHSHPLDQEQCAQVFWTFPLLASGRHPSPWCPYRLVATFPNLYPGFVSTSLPLLHWRYWS